ncbi:MAG: hypothetical protein [Wendovervirus sonii]|uniref:Uncharacterized protein n=1 Tax=phage Lak_Megaphage_Sonny TaxID=3109229 RepID=A0ABZ0Z791_9CAUD|nr:MAG: hypothetical protein [phage Lak_Megaphage_Sonny]
MNIASILVLTVFIGVIILVIINFSMTPTKAKAVLKEDGKWYISLKRIWWDVCEERSEAQEFCRTTLPISYPFINKEAADNIVNDINIFLEK